MAIEALSFAVLTLTSIEAQKIRQTFFKILVCVLALQIENLVWAQRSTTVPFMSSSAPARPSQNKRDGDPIFFWIRSVDENGKSVDEALIKIAYEKAADFLRYRATELRDEAIRADLVETAVYAVSSAGRTEGFRDVRGYLFAVFKRLVDQRIGRDRRENTQLPADRDGGSRIVSREPEIEDQVYSRELLDVMREVMDEKTIWAWERRMLGYRLEEIAAELNVSADTLSTRLRRGRDAARKRLAGKKR